MPAFPSGAGGLVSTVDDWLRFARVVLADGSAEGRSILSTAPVGSRPTTRVAGSC